MNNGSDDQENYRSYLLLEEISKGEPVTQRELSKTLGVALGLINSYVKNLISKGYITVSKIPKKRYQYYLTPSGFAEKTRLTFQHFQNFTNLYKIARRDFHSFFNQVQKSEIRQIAFCGVDEIAEIAYLSLKETGLVLTGIIDDREAGKIFFDHKVRPIAEVSDLSWDMIVITAMKDPADLKARLLKSGVSEAKIVDLGAGDWLKKIGG